MTMTHVHTYTVNKIRSSNLMKTKYNRIKEIVSQICMRIAMQQLLHLEAILLIDKHRPERKSITFIMVYIFKN